MAALFGSLSMARHRGDAIVLESAAASVKALRDQQTSFRDHLSMATETHNNDRGLATTLRCFPASDGSTHFCENTEQPITVDPSLPPFTVFQLCSTGDNVTVDSGRRPDQCGSTCYMWSPLPSPIDGESRVCDACASLESGEFVYDCRNLFPDASCATRNTAGVCSKEPYDHWRCLNLPGLTGDGFICTLADDDGNNPVFEPDDSIPNDEVETDLLCSNDIGGMNYSQCQDPICTVSSGYIDDDRYVVLACESCELLVDDRGEGTFSYNCIDEFPNLTCPIRLDNGTCLTKDPKNLNEFENTTLWNVPSYVSESQASYSNEDVRGSGWTLKNIDPTVFNVLTDIYDKIIMVLFGISIAIIFPAFVSWQVKRGKAVPANTLGHVPSDFWAAVKGLQTWQLSLPGLVLIILIIAADFSHSVADAGLEFVTLKNKGSNNTVLVLGANAGQRNPHRPFETAGDPLSSRTFVINKNQDEGNWKANQPEVAAMTGYLGAVALIARGLSPFTETNKTQWRVVTDFPYSNVTTSSFRSYYVDNDAAPLVSMDLELPLKCTDSEMAKIERLSKGIQRFDDALLDMIAWVPNCSLAALRPSGLYPGASRSAEILETIENLDALDFFQDTKRNILLTNGTDKFVAFNASTASKRLSRDREDWTSGRRFFDVDGIEIGNLTIKFANVFLGSGARISNSAVDVDTERNEYSLVAEVDGDCPQRPSGLRLDGEQCLVTLLMWCDTFPEDTKPIVHPIYQPLRESSLCKLLRFTIIWGRNFQVDEELAAVTAGIYGLVRPSSWDMSVRTFNHNGILAALFALGLVDERPEVEEVVRPRVNVTFVVFILLPLSLSIAFLILAIWVRGYSIHIPAGAWEFLVMGAEEPDMIAKRAHKGDPFPKVDNDLVFAAFYDARQPEDDGVEPDEVESDKTVVYGLVKRENHNSFKSKSSSETLEGDEDDEEKKDNSSSKSLANSMDDKQENHEEDDVENHTGNDDGDEEKQEHHEQDDVETPTRRVCRLKTLQS